MSVVVNNNKAKNVIMFLGDGMSIATVTAARIYKGQLENMTGEEQRLSWEMFPYTGLSKVRVVLGISKTLSIDKIVFIFLYGGMSKASVTLAGINKSITFGEPDR